VSSKYKFIKKREQKSNVLISGGSGLIGAHLSKMLLEKGYGVAILGRTKNTENTYLWNIAKQEIENGAIENADYIINLAGTGIADKKWTTKRKKEIVESRTKPIQLLHDKITKNKTDLKAFISASAIGYYGALTTDTVFTEENSSANDFLAKTCKLWENEIIKFEKKNCRTVILRTGIVLSKKGGALEKIAKPIKMNIGSALGNGKQFVPWIHIQDLCNIYIKAIENNEIKGVFNAVAPEHIRYSDFAKTIAQILNKPFFMPNVPKIALKIALGEMSIMLLEGSRISSDKIKNTGFKFEYPRVKNALINLLK
jgi:hypothetical protein